MKCLICERIELIKKNKNPYFVKELKTGYVVIGDYQKFRGYTLFLCKKHVKELHHLDKDFKVKYLEEMSIVNEAVQIAFKAEKMNVELLGNGDAHLHFHLFPRNSGDMPIKGPVWWTPKEEMYHEKYKVSSEDLDFLKEKLLIVLECLLKN
ncbi:MAG: HIT family protein [Bacilli bacterium]|nr:HIT family protein [Bacilli bacterium]